MRENSKNLGSGFCVERSILCDMRVIFLEKS